MKSIRSWFAGLALGLTLGLGAHPASGQGLTVPNGITYQALIENNGAPFNGNIQLEVYFRDASNTTTFFQQTIRNVLVHDGILDLVLGNPFPTSMKFDQQYSMQVVINNATTMSPTLLWSAPYALNSARAGGLDVSPVPVAGNIFPVPVGTGYTGAAKLDPAFLPAIPNSSLQVPAVLQINDVTPDGSGNVRLVPGGGMTVTPNYANHTITISSSTGGISSVTGTNGLQGGGSGGDITLSIAPAGITSSMLSAPLQIGSSGATSPTLTVVSTETNGSSSLMVKGGLGANNPTGTADGTGLTPGSPQTYWADQVTVPASTMTTLTVYNTLVSTSSVIILTPYAISPAVSPLIIAAQASGTFTIGSATNMGTSGGGSITGINYEVINH